MSHVREHCRKPSTRFKRAGSLWACTCGKIFVIVWRGGLDTSRKCWSETELKVKENK